VLERSGQTSCATIVPGWPGLFSGLGLTVFRLRRLDRLTSSPGASSPMKQICISRPAKIRDAHENQFNTQRLAERLLSRIRDFLA
jgi:hypothetical protein